MRAKTKENLLRSANSLAFLKRPPGLSQPSVVNPRADAESQHPSYTRSSYAATHKPIPPINHNQPQPTTTTNHNPQNPCPTLPNHNQPNPPINPNPTNPTKPIPNPPIKPTHQVEAHLVQVFLLFGEMRARGVDPDRAAYNALMEACARAGAADQCAGVLNDMVNKKKKNKKVRARKK